MSRVIVDGSDYDAHTVARLMDDDLYERLQSTQDWQSAQDFVDAYCRAHAEKFGQPFIIGSLGGPWWTLQRRVRKPMTPKEQEELVADFMNAIEVMVVIRVLAGNKPLKPDDVKTIEEQRKIAADALVMLTHPF